MRHLIQSVLLVAFAGLWSASAAAAEPLLTVEFPSKEGVCLTEDERSALLARMKKLVIPPGTALTIIAYTSTDERSTKKKRADCVAHLVPTGIAADQRVAVMRALHVAELGAKLALPGFSGTSMLLIGSGPRFRNQDNGAVTIIARRGHGSTESDRRVEVWSADSAAGVSRGAQTVMAPALLPPIAYGSPGAMAAHVPGAGQETVTEIYSRGPNGQELLGWTFIGLGLTALVGGGFSFAQAESSSERADQVGFDRTQSAIYEEDADLFRQVAYWSGGLGAGLATLGIVLLATAQSDEAVAARSDDSFSIVPAADLRGAVLMYNSTLPGGSW